MVVGVCRLDLQLPGNDSLKNKRRVANSLVDRIHNKFNVAAAEVALQDRWQRLVLGVTCVSNDNRHVDSVLQQVVNWVDKAPRGVLVDYHTERIHVSG